MKLAVIHDELLYEGQLSEASWSDRKQAYDNEIALNNTKKKIIQALKMPFNFPEHYADYRNAYTDDRTSQARIEEYASEVLQDQFSNARDILTGNFLRDPKSSDFRFRPNLELLKVLAPRTDPNAVYKKLYPILVDYEKELKQNTAYAAATAAPRKEIEAEKQAAEKEKQRQEDDLLRSKNRDARRAAEQEASRIVSSPRGTNSPISKSEPWSAWQRHQAVSTSESVRFKEIYLMEAGVLGSAARALFNPRGSLVSRRPQITVNDLKWLEGYYRNIMLHRKMIELTAQKYFSAIRKERAAKSDTQNIDFWKGISLKESPRFLIALLEMYPKKVDSIVATAPAILKTTIRNIINDPDVATMTPAKQKYISYIHKKLPANTVESLMDAINSYR